MIFLSPIPAIIAAAAAVPTLTFFYLLKLRRRPVRVSSTLLWTQAICDLQVNVPFRWLRPTWLFVLQLLALSLLLLALARPAANLAGAPAQRIVLVIDRSASMSAPAAAGGAQTRLAQAVERANRVLDEAARGPTLQVGVIAFASEPRVLAALAPDLAGARAALRSITPTDQPGNAAAALRAAAAILAPERAQGSEESPAPRAEIILFSDGCNAPGEPVALAGVSLREERVGPGDRAGPGRGGAEAQAGVDNVGLVALAARRDYDDPATVRVFVRLVNAAAQARAVPVIARLDGAVVARQALGLPGRSPPGAAPTSSGQPAPDSPAAGPDESQVGLSLAFQHRGGGLLTVTIDRPDDLMSDNSAACVLPPPAKPRVLLVMPDATAGDASLAAGRWIFADPLGEMGLRSLRIISASSYQSAASRQAPLDADLVVFDRVQPLSVPAVPSISFGVAPPVPGLVYRAAADLAGSASSAPVASWQRSHPLLRHVALDTLLVTGEGTIAFEPAPADAGPDVIFSEVARGAGGPLIAEVRAGGVRHLVVAFEAGRSNWPLQVGFPLFLSNAVEWLTGLGPDAAGVSFTTAEPLELRPTAEERRAGRIVLRGPVEVAAPVGVEESRASASAAATIGPIERAGVYERGDERAPAAPPDGSAPAPLAIAVNLLDAAESALRPVQATRTTGSDADGSSGGAEGPRELWPWFVLAALALLSVEWVLNAWRMRV